MSLSRIWILVLALGTGSVHAQTFLHRYGRPNASERGSTLVIAPNGNVIVGGGLGRNGMVVMLTSEQKLVWTYVFPSYKPNRSIMVSSLAITPDGYLIGTANLEPGYDAPFRWRGFMFKMTLQGQLVWCKLSNQIYGICLDRIIPLNRQEYLISCSYEMKNYYWMDVILAKVSAADGRLLALSPRYDFAPSNYRNDPAGCVIGPDGRIYLSGKVHVNGMSNGSIRPYIACFTPNLNLSWVKYYLFPPEATARMYGTEIILSGDALVVLVCGSPNSAAGTYQMGLFKADLQGDLIWSKMYDMPNSTQELGYSLVETSQGYCMIAGEENNMNLFALHTDFHGNVRWCKHIDPGVLLSTSTRWTNGAYYADNHVWFTGNTATFGNSDLLLGKMDLGGEMACTPTTVAHPVTTVVPPYTMSTSFTAYPEVFIWADGPVYQPDALSDFCDRLPSPSLGADTLFCAGTLTLDATVPGANGYLWQDGSTEPTLEVHFPGTYWVSVDLDCCLRHDTIRLLPVVSSVALGPDVTICGDSPVQLDVSGHTGAYRWSTGETTGAITVTVPGIYSVSVTDSLGCIATDDIAVESMLEGSLFVPNVFSPDGDGINDVFRVEGPVDEAFELVIFDRWGKRHFATRNSLEGWDGRIGGVDAPEGVYYYTLRTLGCDRQWTSRAGAATLVR
jgi:gliding motility-associated-like protein